MSGIFHSLSGRIDVLFPFIGIICPLECLFLTLIDKTFIYSLIERYLMSKIKNDMKKIMVLLTLLVLGNQLIGQTKSKNIPISIGLISHAGWQPGVKIGTQFDLKNWETETEKLTKLKSFYMRPQLGFYIYPNTHIAYLVNADFGYKRVKDINQKYSAFSIGLGFLNQSQITERKVNLSDGNVEKTRENWAWFLPTLNYEFGKSINEKIGWYSKFSYGFKIASARENTAVIFIELGVNFNLF